MNKQPKRYALAISYETVGNLSSDISRLLQAQDAELLAVTNGTGSYEGVVEQ